MLLSTRTREKEMRPVRETVGVAALAPAIGILTGAPPPMQIFDMPEPAMPGLTRVNRTPTPVSPALPKLRAYMVDLTSIL
jgi:hypothetical protein